MIFRRKAARMTEFEKSQQGLPHVFDSEMMQMFHRAYRLTRAYNQTGEGETETRTAILAQLLKHAGRNLYIIPDFHCEYGSNITIGSHVLIGPNVSLYTVNHAMTRNSVHRVSARQSRSALQTRCGSAERYRSLPA